MIGEIAIGHQEEQPAKGREPIIFHLLRPFQITVVGQPQWSGPGQEQRLLVKLLAAEAMPIPNEELMEAIWDEVPGPGATSDALYHLVAAARKRLAAAGLEGVLTNANGTYRLDIPTANVDVHVFHSLTTRARELARHGDKQAVVLFEEALRLRHGEPLAGLRGQWIDGYRHTLAEELRAAELDLYETAIKYGGSRERLPHLSTLFRDRPDDELVAWLYIHALYRAGQQTEALAVKRQFSEHLLETSGVENGKALDELYKRILDKDAGLFAPEAVSFPGGEAGARVRELGHPNPRAARGSNREELRQPPADSDSTPPGGPASARRGDYDVVVYYADTDIDAAGMLERHLSDAGARPFLVRWVEPGLVRYLESERALAGASVGVLLFSKATMAVPRIADEYAALLDRVYEGGFRFIPARVQDVTLPRFAAIRAPLDLGQPGTTQYDDAIALLVNIIRRQKGAAVRECLRGRAG
jgi:DNA-binding SARP family transcriptional activator